MTLKLTGKHLVAGEWVDGPSTFVSEPSDGEAHRFYAGTKHIVDQAAMAADAAFETYRSISHVDRSAFIRRIADEIESRAEVISTIGSQETGLPRARLEGERGRTVNQLRLFASHIEDNKYLDFRHDIQLPDRKPVPRPSLRRWQVPVGPVAVFGASNFPLAFSVAGGDTASALAAGCSVVVKGHPAHPGTSEIVAQAIHAAIYTTGVPAGVFSLVQGGSNEIGEALVTHPLIQAVGFTGSLRGGRALFDLCARRPVPIPFFGELGSVNPVFMLPAALGARAETLGGEWAESLTMGAGQFCTNPGVVIALKGQSTERFVLAAKELLKGVKRQVMLTKDIAKAYREGIDRIESLGVATKLLGTGCNSREATPYLYSVSAAEWSKNRELREEVFGPLGVVVEANSESEMIEIAGRLEGQLTCTLHHDPDDRGLTLELLPILERKAGRLISNGFPTGVEVCDAMVHGGPYPASTNFGATSVGTLAIRRFLRPVCYQGFLADIACPK